MVTKYFKKLKKSKKGFTLVEAMCAIMIMAIVFVGILNAVAFSRQMVYTNNSREKASDRAQLVADEMISIATGFDPGETLDPTVTENLKVAIEDVLNYSGADGVGGDPQYTIIGGVEYCIGDFVDASEFDPETHSDIQYKLEPVGTTTDDVTEGTPHKAVTQRGWQITVRVYYQSIGGNNRYTAEELVAFAPTNYIN